MPQDRFDPRAIPGRAHYDRLQTWIKGVFGRMPPDDLAELQADISKLAATAVAGDDDKEKIVAVLAELGFCAVFDSMADDIEEAAKG